MAGDGDEYDDLAVLLDQVTLSSVSNLDLAFKLQLAETIQASPESSDAAYALALQAADLARTELDRRHARAYQASSADSVHVAAHDGLFARQLAAVPEDRWAHDGDYFERPLDSSPRPLFNVLFKGMASKEVVGPRDRDPGVAVLAAAVCDPQGKVVIRVQKPVEGLVGGREVLEAMALMEGLHAALGLGIHGVEVVTDYRTLYNHVLGIWCVKCRGSFCIRCKVPWHGRMSCYSYKRRYPGRPEDVKLQNLAQQKLWRQCVKCKHMIELAEGCYHMTCVLDSSMRKIVYGRTDNRTGITSWRTMNFRGRSVLHLRNQLALLLGEGNSSDIMLYAWTGYCSPRVPLVVDLPSNTKIMVIGVLNTRTAAMRLQHPNVDAPEPEPEPAAPAPAPAPASARGT